MTNELSRYRRDSGAKIASNDDTRRLLAASQKLVAEIARLTGPEADIADRHDWLETMMNHVPDCIYAKDAEGRFLMANHATVVENGFSSMSEIVGKTDFDLHPREAAQSFFDVERRVMETGEPMFDIEELAVVDRGSERWLATSKVPLRNKAGATIGTVGVSRDITQQKRVERLLVGQARLLEKIAKSVSLQEFFNELLGLIESHLQGVVGSVLMLSEDGRQLLTGAAPGLDPAYSAAIHGIEIGPKVGSCGTAAWRGEPVFVADILSDPLWEDYTELVRPFGYRSCWSMPIRSYNGQVLGTFALYSPAPGVPSEEQRELISMAAHLTGIAIERQKTEERIHFMAHHDALTGLPNRMLFDERVALALENARRANQWVALAFLDLDNFKLINDSLGHKAGDELLRIVARRMLSCVRKSDMIVRVGGDEFIILLTDLPAENGIVVPRLEDIRREIAAPLTIAGRSLQVSCSMGVVAFPEHGTTAEELLANADAAMYRAKELGRNNLQIFNAQMAATAHEKLRRYEELREAVAREEFVLHYQPQMNLRSGKIFAAESLLRWQHPERGIVAPGEFIPLAEETGLIVDIGDWALNAACHQNKAWQDAGLPPIVISVNVSARQFRERDWVSRVATALAESGLEARYLELELTESLIMQDVPQAVATMHALEALGIQLAIDDFGTGYSSLSALKRFPVKRLKIDRSFVMDIPFDEDDKAITSAIISLAQELGMEVIAEGVETEAQLEFLRDNGCNEIQGYFFSRPVPAEGLARLISAD
ncbi:diguanylate cyclase (GGDEF)-like protein/PAS domain S-box-containing protein [Pararhizobium capsulatum DSM 1112]|uniref:Diguanylate cyclase (GGDEF)-like protein/PAS domain S-box-containing protein n=1 Tax=Pararhizobium capsulatum DSM 1112 TaxID=1121113 RepID=A0ABU0BMM8_9HYPH|nr:EAL domain-containing protein [Pararhizobium capsulatum]MDQ0319510.1 diguanylate cyclase (GGDEF)-like protein/PAS domain S-box-containing protein [Pararhizobium capsulatum DSM 1112]